MSPYNYGYDTTASAYTSASCPTAASSYTVSSKDYVYQSKTETAKEKIIRQRSAFSLFYSKQAFMQVIRPAADRIEKLRRKEKFKSIDKNLLT